MSGNLEYLLTELSKRLLNFAEEKTGIAGITDNVIPSLQPLITEFVEPIQINPGYQMMFSILKQNWDKQNQIAGK